MSEIRKALTSSGDGAALVPYDLDPVLSEELLKLQPLAQLLPIKEADGKTHEYNIRSSHPQAWFEGEATAAAVQNSVYARKSVQLKIQRIWGSVTGFSRAVTKKFIDNFEAELEGSLNGMGDLMEYGALFGISNDLTAFTGDAYQFTGVLPRLYADASVNVIDGGNAKITLDMLDQAMAAAIGHRQTRNDPGMWFMGMRMKQVVDGLQTKVQLPLQGVELADGKIVMAAYGGRPIFESDMVVPASTSTSPATTATKAAGGALADATYTYQISSVTMYGEQVVGTESAGATTETTNNKVNLTWTADANARSYMIWRKTGAGAYGLLDIIPAKTYASDGTVNGSVEAYSDAGAKTPIAAVKPLLAGQQQIVFVNAHRQRGAEWLFVREDGAPIVRAEGKPNFLVFDELAKTKDTYDYMVKAYAALGIKHPNVHAVLRHVKLS